MCIRAAAARSGKAREEEDYKRNGLLVAISSGKIPTCYASVALIWEGVWGFFFSFFSLLAYHFVYYFVNIVMYILKFLHLALSIFFFIFVFVFFYYYIYC